MNILCELYAIGFCTKDWPLQLSFIVLVNADNPKGLLIFINHVIDTSATTALK